MLHKVISGHLENPARAGGRIPYKAESGVRRGKNLPKSHSELGAKPAGLGRLDSPNPGFSAVPGAGVAAGHGYGPSGSARAPGGAGRLARAGPGTRGRGWTGTREPGLELGRGGLELGAGPEARPRPDRRKGRPGRGDRAGRASLVGGV